jgi:histidine racemase
MGNELSINGILALASLNINKKLFSSGIKTNINYINENTLTTITLNLPYKKENNIVLFDGIGYEISANNCIPKKTDLAKFSKKFRLPAFGKILSNLSSICPYVYVTKTDSLVAETACGSGSIAYALVKGITHVLQPTGQYIQINYLGNSKFQITAQVTLKGGESRCWKTR